jgi:hypothetical protein
MTLGILIEQSTDEEMYSAARASGAQAIGPPT